MSIRIHVLAALAALLVCAPSALAQGGAPAPDLDDPCPVAYPGNEAPKELIARWMGRGAAERGLPPELPVMAGVAESGLRNLRGGNYLGFFGMHQDLNEGDYRGFPRRPALQLRWFLDNATLVRQRRVAEARPDPMGDPDAFGLWVADVERPAPENRSGYQKYLEEAAGLVERGCPGPPQVDSVPPALAVRAAARQRPLAGGGVVVRVHCPEETCLAGATGALASGSRRYSLRAAALDPGSGWTTLTLRLARALRSKIAQGSTLRAEVTVIAADEAANPTAVTRSVRLTE